MDQGAPLEGGAVLDLSGPRRIGGNLARLSLVTAPVLARPELRPRTRAPQHGWTLICAV